MGFKTLSLKLITDFTTDLLRNKISKELRLQNFSFHIENKSLDARNKANIHWLVQVVVQSEEIKSGEEIKNEILSIPYKKRKELIVVVGSGPAGFFAAFVLQKAGFNVTLIERGSEVAKRGKSILNFERTGIFDAKTIMPLAKVGPVLFPMANLHRAQNTFRSKRILF